MKENIKKLFNEINIILDGESYEDVINSLMATFLNVIPEVAHDYEDQVNLVQELSGLLLVSLHNMKEDNMTKEIENIIDTRRVFH